MLDTINFNIYILENITRLDKAKSKNEVSVFVGPNESDVEQESR